ncbi:E3 ubiquitin-protein ligase TRIM39-like [Rhinoraja longicauda]
MWLGVRDEAKPLSVVEEALPIEKFHCPVSFNTTFKETSDGFKQVSVTLDVETAHPGLEVSEDRKRVRWTGTRSSLPDTGKRFTGSECVLGSEGFTSGRHYWEVEVAGSRYWGLGVAAESVERKGPVTVTPETGVWSIRRRGDGFDAFTSPLSRLPDRSIPGRVGVYLSYESGTVSFYDADTKSHLHTFSGNKFTEKLYPYFGPWDENKWLRICSGEPPLLAPQVHLSHFFKMVVMMETLGSSGRHPSSQTKADIDGEIHQLLLRACTKFGRLRRRVFDERISKAPQILVNAALGMRCTG